MQKVPLITLNLICGAYSILNGLGLLSLTIVFISIIIKALWILSSIYIFNTFINKSFLKVILVFIFIHCLIIATKLHRQVSFFPTFGDYELTAIFYNNKDQAPARQSRLEYHTKEYALNNTAEKYEKVEVYLGILEFRKTVWKNIDELNKYRFEKWLIPNRNKNI